MWTHLQPWIKSRQFLNEFTPLSCLVVSSGVHVPTLQQWLCVCAITECSCIQTALLWLSTVFVANEGDPGIEAICFSFLSPYEVSLPS